MAKNKNKNKNNEDIVFQRLVGKLFKNDGNDLDFLKIYENIDKINKYAEEFSNKMTESKIKLEYKETGNILYNTPIETLMKIVKLYMSSTLTLNKLENEDLTSFLNVSKTFNVANFRKDMKEKYDNILPIVIDNYILQLLANTSRGLQSGKYR